MAYPPISLASTELLSETPLPAVVNDPSQLDLCGIKWTISIYELSLRSDHIIYEVGMSLFHDLPHDLLISNAILSRFLLELGKAYLPNPYHNAVHAASVGHFTACLLRYFSLCDSPHLTPTAEAAIYTAALGHDVSHPARNNAFFVNSFDPLAIAYNDTSVLENFHACLTFHTLDKGDCNIFDNLMTEDFRISRTRIIELILATDMRHHYEAVGKFRARRKAEDFDPIAMSEDFWLTTKMCVKMADLGHAALDWEQHVEFSYRVTEEFYQQGDAEKVMGFPVSPLCDRDNHSNFAKSQKGFIEFVTQPFYEEMAEAFPDSVLKTDVLQNMLDNKEHWAEAAESKTKFPMPTRILKSKTDTVAMSRALVKIHETFVKKFEIAAGISHESKPSQTLLTSRKPEPVSDLGFADPFEVPVAATPPL